MKRNVLPVVSLLLAAALPITSVSAQQIVPFVGGGVALGLGDAGENAEIGWLVLGGFDVPLSVVTEGFGFGVAGSFANIPYEGPVDDKVQITSVTAEISYLIGEPTSTVRPYIRGGGGVQIHRYDLDDNTDVMAGGTAGAGVRFALGGADGMIGARLGMAADGGFVGFHAGVAIPVGP
jgi:hypothetical protein